MKCIKSEARRQAGVPRLSFVRCPPSVLRPLSFVPAVLCPPSFVPSVLRPPSFVPSVLRPLSFVRSGLSDKRQKTNDKRQPGDTGQRTNDNGQTGDPGQRTKDKRQPGDTGQRTKDKRHDRKTPRAGANAPALVLAFSAAFATRAYWPTGVTGATVAWIR